jgi:hypothetical protein
MQEKFHVPRYFCEYYKKDKVISSDGMIYISEKDAFLSDGDTFTWPHFWDYYSKYKSIVLLGPPRQGKTSEFKYQCGQVKNGFFLPLRNVTDPRNIEEVFGDIGTEECWFNWLDSNETGELFIDSLDEGNLEITKLSLQITRWLKNKLGKNVLNRLRIHLSCREADWHQLDKEKWTNLFSTNYITLSLLNLDRESIYTYCEHLEVDGNTFLEDIPPSAKSFIQRPQTLKMLLDNYKNDKQFITNTKDLYEKSVEYQLQEYNKKHQQNSLADINLHEKHKIAEYYAVTTVLCGREVIAVSEANRHEHILAGCSNTSPEAEKSVFITPLFEPFKDGQYRFNQPDIANYLAAYHLDKLLEDHTVQLETLLHLFFPSTYTNEPVPFLRELIAWLCNFNPKFRQKIFAKNPSIILHEYYDIPFTDEDRLTIWQLVMQHYGELDWFDDRWLKPYCGKLACEAIIPKLKEVFTKQFGSGLRELALVIIKEGKLKGFLDEITGIINDEPANILLQLYATHALAQTYPEQIPILEKLLNLPTEQEPDNRLFWVALDYLWPKYINFDTLINYLGSDVDRTDNNELFVHNLLERFSIEQGVKILDISAQSLKAMKCSRKNGKEHKYKLSGLEHYFGKFLLVQLKAWKDILEKVSNLESWLMIYGYREFIPEMSYYEEVGKEIQQIIDEAYELRREICCHRIQRLYAEKKEEFKPYRIFQLNKINFVQKEDLEFWQNILLAWSSKELPLPEAVWYAFQNSWAQADYSPKILDWIEKEFPQYPNLVKIWEDKKVCTYDPESMKWLVERNKHQAKHRQKLTNWIKFVQENRDKLTKGNEYLLYNLRELHSETDNKLSFESWTRANFGDDVFDAYKTGLYAHWQDSEVPNLEQMYLDNKIPLWANIVRYAVEAMEEQWSDITTDMRHRALQAGFFALNTLPKWYQELALMEQEYVNELFKKFLNLDLEKKYSSTVNHLKQLVNNQYFYNLAYRFINEHSECRLEMLIPLLQYIIESKLSEDKIDTLWQYAETSIKEDENRGLIYFAAVWRFKPFKVWTWLENNFLNNGQRTSKFETWISAIDKLHMFGIGEHWPSWANEKILLAMIQDFFATYPPETDPSVNEYNYGNDEVKQRDQRRHLRDNTLNTVVASGEICVKEKLNEMLQNPQMQSSREYLFHALEQWQHAHADYSYIRLEQDELWQILKKNAHLVKIHEDLFDLVCKIMTDVKHELTSGGANLKAVLWENRNPRTNKEKWKPATEENLQIIIADQIKKHSLLQNQHIVAGRELEVSGGNRPDIFITCILPNKEHAKVYIEIKRQQYYEKFQDWETSKNLLTAIKEQLAEKYLCDPEARYGIYLVGWYGTQYFKGIDKKLKEKCGEIPKTAQELEDCLQRLCDEVTQSQTNIDDMKAIVIDVSL